MACPGVDQLQVLLNQDFPKSQPRIIACGVKEDGSWPHVEGEGLLCLKATRIGFDPGERVVQHIAWAIELLNFSEDKVRQEFQREFATYWERNRDSKNSPTIYSLVSPVPPSREISCFYDIKKNEIVLHEDRSSLLCWLRNSGRNPGKNEVERTWMCWLDNPPLPSSFPKIGSEVLAKVPTAFLEEVIRPGTRLPVLLGATTETGPAWVAAEVSSARENELLKGFRPARLPVERVIQSMSFRPVRRLTVRRADSSYVHGRGFDPNYKTLAKKRVAIVGCGALGGSILRLLAQAGAGHFLLIDHDILGTQNTARHVLGNRYVGQYKTDALAKMLLEDFPHLPAAAIYRSHVEKLSEDKWQKLAEYDLIVSSGISFVGDIALNNWRMKTPGAPVHLCAWTEPFALAGHAISLFGNDNLMTAFDADGRPLNQLTDWPEETELLVTEAGCGNSFQPHGAIELQRIVTMTAKLALDVLLGKVTSSDQRVWQGDRGDVLRLGGTPSEAFKQSNVESTRPWMNDATREKENLS